MRGTLLVIDDDPVIHAALEKVAEELRFALLSATDGSTGISLATQPEVIFVIVDLGLPDMSGLDVCKSLRMSHVELPIIILTSRNDETSKIVGLEVGADDFVSKPFSIGELAARIRAILRRVAAFSDSFSGPASVVVGDLEINLQERTVSKRGNILEMTRLEFDVLAYFAVRLDRPVTRDELMYGVWGYDCSDFDSTVTTHMSRLRKKVEDEPAKPQYLQTVRGVGYRLNSGKRKEPSAEDS